PHRRERGHFPVDAWRSCASSIAVLRSESWSCLGPTHLNERPRMPIPGTSGSKVFPKTGQACDFPSRFDPPQRLLIPASGIRCPGLGEYGSERTCVKRGERIESQRDELLHWATTFCLAQGLFKARTPKRPVGLGDRR